MAGPIPGAVQQVAQQAVQQQAQRPEATPKTGASKFDQTLASKSAGGPQGVTGAEAIQAAQKAGQAQQVQKAPSADEARKAHGVRHDDPVKNKSASDKVGGNKPEALEQMLSQMEGRHAAMDQFITRAMDGKMKFSQQQLLGMQLKVSQYSLELDLTGKVVEKATSGLKDTLRTQV